MHWIEGINVYYAGRQMPGTFTSVDDYLLWYGISSNLKEGASWIGITCHYKS